MRASSSLSLYGKAQKLLLTLIPLDNVYTVPAARLQSASGAQLIAQMKV